MKTILFASFSIAGLFSAHAQLLPFQGHLTSSGGNQIADGTKVVQFKIYDTPVSGNAVWAGEVHKLSVNGGLVNTILGTKTSFPETYGNNSKVMFSEPLYVEVTVDANDDGQITAVDPPLLPRQVLLPANFAHVAHAVKAISGETIISDSGEIDGSKMKPATIPATAITANDALGANHLAVNSVGTSEISEGAVESSEIKDGTITADDLSAELSFLVGDSANPPGSVTAYMGEVAPDGWLMCDGSEVGRETYARLYAVIGNSCGVGDGTMTFHLPDLRGRFLRGLDGGAGRSPDVLSRLSMNTGGNTGNKVGTVQEDEFKAHRHGISVSDNPGGSGRVEVAGGSPQSTYSSGSAGGSETRPKNAAVNFIIKY